MNETPKYHLPDVTGDLRARVLDLCIHRLWHDALELLYQNGIQHYDRDDLINFYNWAPAYLPAPPAEDPAADRLPASTSPERGVHAASVTNDHQRREARQHPIDLLSAPATPPVAASRESAADSHDRRADSLSAASENPELTASDNGTPITDHRPLITDHAGSALLTDLRDLINRYVVLPEMAADALALWVVHTYAFEFREVTTYIGVVSPEKRCGKTTLLELLRRLANRAVAAANISAPALFRVIQENKPTLLIDEADTFLQGRDELAGILNAGYRKDNAYVVRVADRKNPGGTEFAQYSCWCPKVMAAIGRLPDTLADRCIVITMQRKLPGEQCERMRNLDATEYCKRCAEFACEHGEAIAQARPEIPAALNDRAADIWEPLLAIADLAGGEWPQLARHAALKLSTFDDETTLIGHFLKDLRDWMIFKKVDRMLSRDIVAAFNPAHDRPWEDLRRGREINEWWLSQRMKDLGIRSRAIRVGNTIAKGYLLADVAAACRRYLPSAEPASEQTQKSEQDEGEKDDDDDRA